MPLIRRELEQHFELTPRQGQRYMALARMGKRSAATHSSLRDALTRWSGQAQFYMALARLPKSAAKRRFSTLSAAIGEPAVFQPPLGSNGKAPT